MTAVNVQGAASGDWPGWSRGSLVIPWATFHSSRGLTLASRAQWSLLARVEAGQYPVLAVSVDQGANEEDRVLTGYATEPTRA